MSQVFVHAVQAIIPHPPRLLRPCLLLMLAVLVGPLPVRSHAVLVQSKPEHGAVLEHAPASAWLQFNTVLESAVTRVQLVATGERRTALPVRAGEPGRIVVDLPDLGPGVYSMRYTVLARDGHVSTGSVRFTILIR